MVPKLKSSPASQVQVETPEEDPIYTQKIINIPDTPDINDVSSSSSSLSETTSVSIPELVLRVQCTQEFTNFVLNRYDAYNACNVRNPHEREQSLRSLVNDFDSLVTGQNKGKRTALYTELTNLLNEEAVDLRQIRKEVYDYLAQVIKIDCFIVIDSTKPERIHTYVLPPSNEEASICIAIDMAESQGSKHFSHIFPHDDMLIDVFLVHQLFLNRGTEIPNDYGELRLYKQYLFNNRSIESKEAIYEKVKNVFEKFKPLSNSDTQKPDDEDTAPE